MKKAIAASYGMITAYTVAYNEEILIQFMIDHYRERFPGCRIVVYDNMSTDNTVKIALANGCKVIPFDTNNEFQDRRHMEIKNSCWKNAKTDWVLMCDLDELLDINEAQLKKEESLGTTIIKAKGYNMVTLDDKLDIAGMRYGERDEGEDKSCLFNKKFIKEINFGSGAHVSSPIGSVVCSKKAYKLFNYNYLNCNYSFKKWNDYASRVSQENIKNDWGVTKHIPMKEVKRIYAEAWKKAKKVL